MMNSSRTPRNRITRMRMRDNIRWVKRYREAAYDEAYEEARKRSFLATLFYAVTSAFELRRAETFEALRS